jgi:hypothetical protein
VAEAMPVPRRLVDAQDPDWLTAIMQRSAPGCRVVGVEVVEDIRVVATKSRLRLTYEAGRARGIDSLCIKVFADTDDYMSQLSWMSSREARFYEQLADRIPVRVPSAPYAGVDDDTGLGIVVMEDLEASGARFWSSTEPIAVDLVAQTVRQLADLHAMFATPGVLGELHWLTPVLGPMSERPPIDTDTLQSMLETGRGLGLEPGVLDARRLHDALRIATALDAQRASTLLHGDAHCGNVFELPDGPGFLDWQLVQRGHWARDLAYHLGSSLTVEDAEAHERELVEHYLECVAAAGGDAPAMSDAWEQYRTSFLYGYYLWVVTLRVKQAVTAENCRRLGHAMMRHETLERLERLGEDSGSGRT